MEPASEHPGLSLVKREKEREGGCIYIHRQTDRGRKGERKRDRQRKKE